MAISTTAGLALRSPATARAACTNGAQKSPSLPVQSTFQQQLRRRRAAGHLQRLQAVGPAVAEQDVYSKDEHKHLSLWSEPEVLLAAASFESTLDLTASLDGVPYGLPHEQPQVLTGVEAVPAEEAAKEPTVFAKAWAAYSSALETHPILVKSATSLVGFAIGDTLAQTIVGRHFDIFRTMRLVAFGMFMDGPVGHVWYTFLDKNIMPEDPKSNKAVLAKMMLDQIVWAPIFSCIFFTFIHTLEGHPEMVITSIQNKLWPMYLANLALWPLAHIINFKFVPSQQRILYINCVQILWSAYLSNLASVKLRQKY